MQAKVTWHEDLRFTGQSEGPVTLPLHGGELEPEDREGFAPLQLMLLGLASCTGMDVISILQKKRQQITDFEVRVEASRADTHPRVFTSLMVEYHVTGHEVDRTAVERSIELSEEKYCPSIAMLRQVAPLEHTYQIHEAD